MRMFYSKCHFGTFVSALLLAGNLSAGGPSNSLSESLSYQGTIQMPDGSLPPDGNYDVRFGIWQSDTSTDGADRLWQSATLSVPIQNGILVARPGEQSQIEPDIFSNGNDRWLEVEVDLDQDGFEASEIFSPRIPLTGTAYAFQSINSAFLDSEDPEYYLNSNILLNGTVLELTDGAGTLSVDLSSLATGEQDADADPTNELNIDASLDGTTLEIEDAGGVLSVDLSSLQDGVTDGDADPSNELLQNASLNGTVLGISDAGGTITVDLASLQDGVEDDDSDPMNETNDGFNLNGTSLELKDAGGTISIDLAPIQDGVTDADASPTNELNTNGTLNGTTLEITDAGGTLRIDLSDLQDGVQDSDADPTNELLTGANLNGTTLQLIDSGGTTQVNLASLITGLGDGHSLDALDGSPSNAVFVDNSGNVGVNTTSPDYNFEVEGNMAQSHVGAPVFLGSTTTNLASPSGVSVVWPYAYVTNADETNDSVAVFDVRDPSNPTYIGEDSSGAIYVNQPEAIEASGRIVYSVQNGSPTPDLSALDFLYPNNVDDIFPPDAIGTSGPAGDLEVSGSRIFVASTATDEVLVYERKDDGGFSELYTITSNIDEPVDVAVRDDILIVANAGTSDLALFRIISVDGDTVDYITSIGTNMSDPSSVDVSEGYAYVTSRSDNFIVKYDIRDPENPTYITRTNNNLSQPVDVEVRNGLAWILSNGGSLSLYDVSSPTVMIRLGTISTNLSGPLDLDVRGNICYVASTGNDTLAIFGIDQFESSAIETSTIATGGLNVTDKAHFNDDTQFGGGVTIESQTGLYVAGPAYFGGDVTVRGTVVKVLKNNDESKAAETVEIDLIELQEMITDQQRVIEELIQANQRLEERLEVLEK